MLRDARGTAIENLKPIARPKRNPEGFSSFGVSLIAGQVMYNLSNHKQRNSPVKPLYNTSDDFAGYTHYDDFACYCSQQNSKRLLSILDLVATTVFFAARNATRGFAETPIEISNKFKPEDLSHVKEVPLSMHWLAQGKAYSKRLASTLRDELEEMGLWKIDRQPPRLGISQPITRLKEFNWRGLFSLAKAAVLRLIDLHGEEGRSPDWTELLPSHEFAWFSGMFRRAFGMPLFYSEDDLFTTMKPFLEQFWFKREISFLEVDQYFRSQIKIPAFVHKAVRVVKSLFTPKSWGDLPY